MYKAFFRSIKTDGEQGQAIVIMALAMVALIAVLGLAIDGGGLLLLQRSTQNATDAAILAATYARCTNAVVGAEAAALAAAAANGFNNDGVTNTVTMNYPPTSGPRAGDTDHMEVIINAKKTPYFIQLIYRGPLEVTVRAVGYCSPAFNPTTMPPLWAGSRTCANTVNWTGSSARVEGGIFSNNEIKFGGGGGTVINGDTEAVNAVDASGGNETFNPAPVTGVDPEPYPSAARLRDFAPTGSVTQRVIADGGVYTWITDPDNVDPDFRRGDWTPANGRELRGLYYIEGDVTFSNGNVFHPDGVTVIATGEIKGSGGATWRYYVDGILGFSDHTSENCGDNGISISGNRATWYGVLFAPKAGVSISGSQLTIYGAIIGNTIDISGSNLVFQYDPTMLPPRPPLVQIAE